MQDCRGSARGGENWGKPEMQKHFSDFTVMWLAPSLFWFPRCAGEVTKNSPKRVFGMILNTLIEWDDEGLFERNDTEDQHTDSASGVISFPASTQGWTVQRDQRVEDKLFRAKGDSCRKQCTRVSGWVWTWEKRKQMGGKKLNLPTME